MGRLQGRPKTKVPTPVAQPPVSKVSTSVKHPFILEEIFENVVSELALPQSIGEKEDEVDTMRDAEVPEKKLWFDVISGNRIPANGLALSYVAPNIVNGEIEVNIESEDTIGEIRHWDNTLIMYVFGKDLSMNTVKQFMTRFWNFAQLLEIFYHDEGYFLLKFGKSKDKELVLMRGPYSIHNMPMVLKEWGPQFNFKRDMIRTLPVWVTFPNLPLYLWGPESLGKIGSTIGKPLFSDECTTNKLRVSYAPILVEIDITQQQKESIIIRDNVGEKMVQPIEFDWKPRFCEVCQKLGHDCKNERKNVLKEWKHVPKSTEEPPKEVRTSNNHHDQVSPSWTQVTRKLKGKVVLQDNDGNLESNLHCTNDFDPLRALNGPFEVMGVGT